MSTISSAPFSIDTQYGALQSNLDTTEQARELSEQFEGVYLNQMLSSMFEGIGDNDCLGGGYAEQTYRGLLTETYADTITKSGGIGIADSIMRELISLQEME